MRREHGRADHAGDRDLRLVPAVGAVRRPQPHRSARVPDRGLAPRQRELGHRHRRHPELDRPRDGGGDAGVAVVRRCVHGAVGPGPPGASAHGPAARGRASPVDHRRHRAGRAAVPDPAGRPGRLGRGQPGADGRRVERVGDRRRAPPALGAGGVERRERAERRHRHARGHFCIAGGRRRARRRRPTTTRTASARSGSCAIGDRHRRRDRAGRGVGCSPSAHRQRLDAARLAPPRHAGPGGAGVPGGGRGRVATRSSRRSSAGWSSGRPSAEPTPWSPSSSPSSAAACCRSCCGSSSAPASSSPRSSTSTWRVVVYAMLQPHRGAHGAGRHRAARHGQGPGDDVFIGWFGPRGLASVVFALLAVEELGAAATRGCSPPCTPSPSRSCSASSPTGSRRDRWPPATWPRWPSAIASPRWADQPDEGDDSGTGDRKGGLRLVPLRRRHDEHDRSPDDNRPPRRRNVMSADRHVRTQADRARAGVAELEDGVAHLLHRDVEVVDHLAEPLGDHRLRAQLCRRLQPSDRPRRAAG